MRILFVGDVVGKAGRTAISEHLPGMIRDWAVDLVIVNGENAAGGFGITEAIYTDLIETLEFENLVIQAVVTMESAANRTESRGAQIGRASCRERVLACV